MSKYDYFFVNRATVDRRSPAPRRVDTESALQIRGTRNDRRRNGDPRKSWEDREGWERVTLWTSAPMYLES